MVEKAERHKEESVPREMVCVFVKKTKVFQEPNMCKLVLFLQPFSHFYWCHYL